MKLASKFQGIELLVRPAAERVALIIEERPFATPVPLEGHELKIDWKAVVGQNDVEVDAADLQVGRFVTVDATAQEWPLSQSGQSFDVSVQNAPRVRSLTLHGLKSGAAEIHNSNDLDAQNRRLVVTVATDGAFGQPLYAVPAVPANGVMTASFTGASFSNDVLTLPDVAAKKIRLTLVEKDFPSKVQPQPMALSSVSGVGATPSSDASINEAGGGEVWKFPGELPARTLTVDLRHAIEKLLKPKAKAKNAAPLTASFKMKGTGQAAISFNLPRGAVIRRVPGVLTTELAGEARPLAIPDPPLPDEVPSRAVADVTVKYHGIRLLDQFRDAVPAQSGGVAGVVVAEAPVMRKLPPAALHEMTAAKIGIIGRAPVDCELVVQLVDLSSGAPAGTLTDPATATLTASDQVSIIWLDVPKHEPLRVPVGVFARTNHGRFLWAAGPEPLLRIAIFDPNPGGRSVTIGGSETFPINKSELHGPAIAIGAQLFARTLPLVDSLLFATVDVSDLRLEYDR